VAPDRTATVTVPAAATTGVVAQTSVTTDGSVGVALTVICLLVVGIVALRRWR